MAAYLVAAHTITDRAKFEEYGMKARETLAKYGGRFLTKGGSQKFPEGASWKPERVLIIEFPDAAALNAWYSSPEYQPLIALRKASTGELDLLITLDGA